MKTEKDFLTRDEILYLYSFIASKLISHEKDHRVFYKDIAEETLNKIIHTFPNGAWADSSLYLLGTLAYHEGKYKNAEEIFISLAQDYPHSKSET